MAPENLLDEYCRRARHGQALPVDEATRLLGVSDYVLSNVARLAYPLSQPQQAVQMVLSDLVRVVHRRKQAQGLQAALAELASAASEPGGQPLFEMVRTSA